MFQQFVITNHLFWVIAPGHVEGSAFGVAHADIEPFQGTVPRTWG